MNALEILEKYYLPHTSAYAILRRHSELVADKALAIARHLATAQMVDCTFVYEAALLHDIGIFATHSPPLGCYGWHPYLCHGLIGGQVLRTEGLPRHARVCENHIGVGLTAEEIVRQQLPLPAQDFLPQTIEEQIIAYADLFYSKNPSRLEQSRSIEQVRKSVVHYGIDKGAIFDRWHALFLLPDD